MFSDPEIEKMIIFGLIGVCIVLFAAVIYLAVKRNVYYIDETGKEVPAPAKKSRKFWKPDKPEKTEAEPAVEETPAEIPAEDIPVPAFTAQEETPVIQDEIEEVVFPTEEPEIKLAGQIEEQHNEIEDFEIDLPDSKSFFDEEPDEESYSAETTIMQFPEKDPNETLSVSPLEPVDQLVGEEEAAPLRMIKLEEEDFPEATEEEIESMPVPKPVGVVLTVKVKGHTVTKEIDMLPCLIGRDASVCNLVISEPAVSRRHARMGYDGKAMYIEDVSEHNGTFVNGTKLPSLGRTALHENDKINLGRAEITINQFLY